MPWKVVEFQDTTGQIMVARVPPEGTAELVSGSQLLVQDGQVAAFFHEGRPADMFRAGRYALTTQNLPVLGALMNLATLSRSPFRSCVYFVALKTFTDLGWGTTTPILFRDQEFRMVNLRAHGSFAIRISQPKLFLQTVVGTQGCQTTHSVEQYLRRIIVSRLTQVLPGLMTTVLDLPQRYEQLAVQVKQAVREQFDQYGIELTELLVEAITLPAEVQEAINQAAGTRAVGTDELGHYERVMQAQAVRDAAKQPGGGAGTGVVRDPAPDASAQGAAPTAEQIKAKLRELRSIFDEGLIGQEEFDARRKQWLDQL